MVFLFQKYLSAKKYYVTKNKKIFVIFKNVKH